MQWKLQELNVIRLIKQKGQKSKHKSTEKNWEELRSYLNLQKTKKQGNDSVVAMIKNKA